MKSKWDIYGKVPGFMWLDWQCIGIHWTKTSTLGRKRGDPLEPQTQMLAGLAQILHLSAWDGASLCWLQCGQARPVCEPIKNLCSVVSSKYTNFMPLSLSLITHSHCQPGQINSSHPSPKGHYCEGIPLLKAKWRSLWLWQDYYTSNTYIHAWIHYSREL